MNGWFMFGAAAAGLGVVLLWLGRESRTREPQYGDDGSVVLPCDIHRAAYVCGAWSIATGAFAWLLGDQITVSRTDWLFFTIACLLLLVAALGLVAASRVSASFTPAGISIQHPLQSVQIPWSSFQRLEPGPHYTGRWLVTPSGDVSVQAPRPLRSRAARDLRSGVFNVSPESLVGGYSMFTVELAQARARLAPEGAERVGKAIEREGALGTHTGGAEGGS